MRINAGTLKPGDSIMLNNPYNGGTHLPDVTVVTPVFSRDAARILFIVASRGHHADIGGRTPGSAPPDSRHIDEEGVLIDNFKMVEQGRLRDAETRTLLASARYPARNIDQNMADLRAQIAANETGVCEILRMVEQFGQPVVDAYMRHVQDNAEAAVRRAIETLKEGEFHYEMDSGSAIHVAVRVDRATRTATIDFTGTSPQSEFNYNAPAAVCRAVVLYVFRTLSESEIPLNEGCLKPLTIIAPEGSMLNPRYPAAVIAGNTEVSQAATNALFGALGVLAGSQGTMNNFVWGNDRLQNYETICGGTGAGDGFDGASAVHSHMTNTRMTDPEILEWRFPVRLESFTIRRGSGGAGRWRGGDGVVRRMRFLEAMTVTTLGSHRKIPPFGLAGGKPGACGVDIVERVDGTIERLEGNDRREMQSGDLYHMETPAGGGYGSPE
jgi:5-oxoprolinase (ATP-hydrolysing)